jgi:Big-like domain-containing protein
MSDTGPPTVEDKTVQTKMNTPVQIILTGTDPVPGEVLKFSMVANPSHGSAVTDPTTNTTTYTPTKGFTGTDTFTYKATTKNGQGIDSKIATVSVTITSPGMLGGYGKTLAFISVISAGLLLSLFFTVNNEYIPQNTTTSFYFPGYPANRSIDLITVTKEPVISVPFRSILPLSNNMVSSNLAVTIYHNNKTISDMNVQKVTLSSPPDQL